MICRAEPSPSVKHAVLTTAREELTVSMDMPKMWRVYTGADGQSHIAEMPFEMKPFIDVEGAHGDSTPMQRATAIAFRTSPPGYVLDWHCAPRRQYSISLSGTAEIEVGDGTVARIEPGDVVLAEDLTGQGHITRAVGDQPRVYAIVPLAEDGAR
jgi:quercetin dioxygenase-like cupin family protein